jgi:hypothetical protein
VILNRKSLFAFVFCCLFLTSTSFYVSKWKDWGSQALISWDISGYYLYLPGIFYDDLGKLHQRQYIIDTYHPCGNDLYAYWGPKGNYIIKYSSGMAIMYLPGFTIGHIWAKTAGYPVDGFSYPYQFSMAMYSLLVSFLGLWLARILLLKFFEDITVAIALVALCLATNYLNYSAICSMFSHNYLFTIYLLIILFTIRWHSHPDYKKTIALGILCGLAALTRPTEIICVLIPILWGVKDLSTFKQRGRLLLHEYRKVLIFSFCAIIIGSIQLIYWKIYTGHFLYWSYGSEEGFNFTRVPVWNCFLGYKKGWFTYTPFMILSLVGFVPLFKNKRELFLTTVLFSFLSLYITFSWKCWWYGGSFSMRAVVQYYSVLLFPLSAFIEWTLKRRVTKAFFILFLVFSIWLNLVMTYQANGGRIMESDNMSKAYYWRILGKLHENKSDKKFIDTDEEMPAPYLTHLTPLANNLFCVNPDSIHCAEFQNKEGFIVGKNVEYLPETMIDISDKKGKWFRISCEINLKKGEDDYWKKPLLSAWLTDTSSNVVKQKSYRIERVIEWNRWENIWIDIYAPNEMPLKYLKGGIYNPKGDIELLVRSIKIEYANL